MNIEILGFFYFFLSFLMFIFSGILILGVSIELFNNFINFFQCEFFNSLSTLHGLIMIFGFMNPCFTGLSYLVIPNLIFNYNLFFFKMSFLSFLFLFFSIVFLIFSFFLPFNNVSSGWTLYTPLSLQLNYNFDFMVFSVYFFSFSSMLSSINISFTILNYFYLTILKMPMFLWVYLMSSYLSLIVLPILVGLMTMLIFDKYFKTSFFNPYFEGNSLMYQHMFWFFGHPEVYMMMLPSFGMISQMMSVFSKKKFFSYKSVVYALMTMSLMSLMVWGHHMYISNTSFFSSNFFMYCTMLVSIPTGIKIFNWFFTIWSGFIYFETPFLFCIGFLYFFMLGGFSGIVLSSMPLDIFFHGTYFVVAHFHFILVSSSMFSMYSCFYYWSPLIFNVKFNSFSSKMHFWLSFFFLNFSFIPMHFLGFKGMPSSYIDYNLNFSFYNKFVTFSSIIFGFSQLYFFYFILYKILCF